MSQRLLIAMPVYNALPYLAAALESVLQQDVGLPFTLLTIDDGSNDGSRVALEELARRDERVVVKSQNRLGAAQAMNVALEFARGQGFEFIARTDADDVNLPRRFGRQIEFMSGHPNVAASSGNAHYVDAAGARIGSSTVPLKGETIRREIAAGLRGLIQGCAIFRVGALAEIGGYDPRYRYAEDTDIFVRLSERFELGNIPDFLYEIRLHGASHSVQGARLNTIYSRLAIHNHRLRTSGRAPVDFEQFQKSMPARDRAWVARESASLHLWRWSLREGNAVSRTMAQVGSVLLRPERAVARLRRRAERKQVGTQGQDGRPRVAFVTNFIQHYRVQTFETLSKYVDVDYYLYSQGGERYWLPEHGVRQGNVRAFQMPGFDIAGTTVSPALPVRLAKGDYDLYLSGIVGRFSLPATYATARSRGKPFVLWTGVWHRIGTRAHRAAFPMLRHIYRNADAIVVYGSHVRDYLISEGVRSERIFIAPHAVENEAYSAPVSAEERVAIRAQWGVPQGAHVVLYIGRLVEEKGLPGLIRAFAEHAPAQSVLVLVGSGPDRAKLESLAAELGIVERVRFAGYVQPSETYRLYAAADVYVLPSITTPTHKEPWGLVVNEAFNQGLPVIASDSVGAAAGGFLKDGINGLVYPEADWQALGRALSRMLTDAAFRQRLSVNAREQVRLQTNERMVQGFLAAFEYVLKQRRPT